MRLHVKVGNRPGIIVGYGPDKHGPKAIVLIAGNDHPVAVDLHECKLPKLPKRLQRRARAFFKHETQEVVSQIEQPN